MNLTDAARGMPSYAKANLFLEVTDKRPDGFHNIESVFVEIDLHDTLSAKATGKMPETPAISLACSDATLPTDERNLVVKAIERFRRHFGIAEGNERECGAGNGLSLHLRKTIPMGSGLGGGSSNAALALRVADAVWGTRLPPETLAELAADIGSDVPFFLHGGACLCRGRGEVVTSLSDFPGETAIILALPPIHSDTAKAYRGLTLPGAGERRHAEAFIRAMERGDEDAMERAAFNRFEKTVFAALPDLARLHAELESLAGRPVRMSGSGAALWHFASRDLRDALDSPDGRRKFPQKLAAWAEQNNVRLVAAKAVPQAVRDGVLESALQNPSGYAY